MSHSDERDTATAAKLLEEMTLREMRLEQRTGGSRVSPGVALELARMLCHIAGGDGRGVFHVVHDPGLGPDQPPVTAFDLAPLVLAQRDHCDAHYDFEGPGIARPSDRLIEWAEWVAAVGGSFTHAFFTRKIGPDGFDVG